MSSSGLVTERDLEGLKLLPALQFRILPLPPDPSWSARIRTTNMARLRLFDKKTLAEVEYGDQYAWESQDTGSGVPGFFDIGMNERKRDSPTMAAL
ncbi:hypothetical protein O1611_g1756 [Lasiodiplodia mahajangana]|uniref:Uncharacterized protein n=1 Tax=Lasiodiplodia mahajangana TaxID=1108764 RepID=A0ACC2JWH1_9PEZI|nr:hypothetical protein O1611_g1756 [Lasiodiplodia mahajangana]